MSEPIKKLWMIRRLSFEPHTVGKVEYFEAGRGLWWSSPLNATQFSTERGARSHADEWELANVEIVPGEEHRRVDTQTDEGEAFDPNDGEDWKKKP